MLFQGGEQLFLYVTVYDGKVTSKTEVWARILNSSAATNSTALTHERPQPGATAFLPNFRPSFPKGDSSGGGNIPPSFIQPPSPLPESSRKPRPPPPPPPPPLSLEQTTLRIPYTSTTQKPTRGSFVPLAITKCGHHIAAGEVAYVLNILLTVHLNIFIS